MTPIHELDVRDIPPAERHARVFRTFDGLHEGGRFILVSDHDPRPLLYTFQAERPGAFEWNLLEGGPTRFRVEIVRRAGTGGRAVTECLMTDHGRLDGILTEVGNLVIAGDYEAAGRRFAEFACGLNRHIEMEEKVLFPVFEKATGMTGGGPTEVMRQDHVAIRRFMDAAAAAIRSREAGPFSSAVMALRETIGPHNIKEEHILYPMTDQAAGGERDRDDIVRKMQAL
jgi:uncharacterized protein (DUF2249 family)/hemerythrin-like domain-containing protein